MLQRKDTDDPLKRMQGRYYSIPNRKARNALKIEKRSLQAPGPLVVASRYRVIRQGPDASA